MPDLTSRPYRPNAQWACPRCVFGRGQHADFCDTLAATLDRIDVLVSEDVPPDEVWLADQSGTVLAKIVNLKTD